MRGMIRGGREAEIGEHSRSVQLYGGWLTALMSSLFIRHFICTPPDTPSFHLSPSQPLQPSSPLNGPHHVEPGTPDEHENTEPSAEDKGDEDVVGGHEARARAHPPEDDASQRRAHQYRGKTHHACRRKG